MPKYEAGDMNKIIDAVIALDAGMTALMQAISRHDRPLSNEICVVLAVGIRAMPANIRKVTEHLAGWKEILENPPNLEEPQ